MTELEKIAYAKSFIDKLANGINPIDDTPVKNDDVVNNIRLSRCLFYVSDILRQVVENGGIIKSSKHLVPFSISMEQLSNFSYSDTPIAISEIAKRINQLIDTDVMRKITYKDLTAWLISIDMLKVEIDTDGKTRKQPTTNGIEIGISTEIRTSQKGAYTVVLYNKSAQQFMIDNLESIIELKNASKN
ncbi:MAG: hypothetical protein IKW45_01860 [Clostridia bacterium]|nr:hypothetical protein [Clostridia bacterium]